MNGPVVVGVDSIDTSHGRALLEFAAHEAQLRDTALWLVHAYQWTPPVAFGLTAGAAAEQAMRGAAGALLNEAAALVRAEHPDLRLEIAPVSGSAAQSLPDICPVASLVVVGGRGRGGFAGQMLGSVALRVLTLARHPVVVVRGDMHSTTREVLVAVDVEAPATGSEVLGFAFAEASLRHVGVHAVHACDRQDYTTSTAPRDVPEQLHYIDSDRRQALDAILEPWAEKYPDVKVTADVYPGSASKVLVDETGTVDLIVLGGSARAEDQGRGGMRIGALAHTVLHHAHCPVVIVPEH